MPKLIIHSPAGTFDAADRQRIAGALTALGLDCETLPASSMVRSTVWTYFTEYAADARAVALQLDTGDTRRFPGFVDDVR